MKKKRLAITGCTGFIGSHLFRKAVVSGNFECIEVPRILFSDAKALSDTLKDADAVIHLAGLSRHENGDYIYQINTELTRKIAEACTGEQIIYLASTVHEKKELPYHASKRESRRLLEEYGKCGILLMSNTFGPGSKPFYNSVVSTFCKMAAEGKTPERIDSVMLQLIGIDDLCRAILKNVLEEQLGEIVIPPAFEIGLPELWANLQSWRSGKLPDIRNRYDLQLYQAFISYL